MKNKNLKISIFFLLLCNMFTLDAQEDAVKILDGFRFTEGPAIDSKGNLFFSDVPEQKIYKYNLETKENVLYLDNTGGANGLYFNNEGMLIACAGRARQVISINNKKETEVLAEEYNNKKLNSPNDLWIDAQGGIYFTDPRYGNKDNLEQDGMHVYYIKPESKEVVRVIANLTRPNGIIGSGDGKKLYVVDEGERKTYVFDIVGQGNVKNKALFCDGGIDGMSITGKGNICITNAEGVSIYAPDKELLKTFTFDVKTTNVVWSNETLFVTTQSGELYRIDIGTKW